MAEEIRFFELNTGAKIPSVALGTFQPEILGLWPKQLLLLSRLDTDIDCASSYRNQAEIGSALKRLFDEGVVKREEVHRS
ncbi:hypothetical protein PIB30_041024 [Stylosanthes scabra]|uniref:Uncharacterized protein n=1 Tax=Stylosanthes scabra TaxID=79078 RepID=A0ABU6ZDI0_9FABA|nr:hypothetical protein [Stylosanthes scabra]